MSQPINDRVSSQTILKRVDQLSARLRRRQLVGSRAVALEVIKLLRDVVSGARYSSFADLVGHINKIGQTLQAAGPKELVVSNIFTRVRLLLNEEYSSALARHLADDDESPSPSQPTTPAIGGPLAVDGTGSTSQGASGSFFGEVDSTGSPSRGTGRGNELGSIFDLLGFKSTTNSTHAHAFTPGLSGTASTAASPGNRSATSSPGTSQILQRSALAGALGVNPNPAELPSRAESEFSKTSFKLKPYFLDAIKELLDEVEGVHSSVGEQAADHIHSGEFILTIGKSITVESFLKAAHKKQRNFTVIVAETAPTFSGRETAQHLSQAGITTILIPDSNIFALLPRCSKVLIGPHLVLADGALLSIAGSLPLCIAASRMRVPVAVCGGMFKFSPTFYGDVEWAIRDLGSPEQVLAQGEVAGETEVLNPYYDVVPAEFVSLYITNLGGHPSSLLSRLLQEQYGSV